MDEEVLEMCILQDLLELGIPKETATMVCDCFSAAGGFQQGRQQDAPSEPVVEGPPDQLPIIRPPPDLCCPITRDLLVDPVTAADGETYERSAIERWLADKMEGLEAAKLELRETGNSNRAKRAIAAGVPSPLGHGSLAHGQLVPSRAVKRLAEKWQAENPFYGE
uniref:U-box domain-containing protein n=1 Tax=Octactis speculum TaxID=3111310 RepID=A0A7S2D790_9STRA|mmetsp:Transcript_44296/g.60529  ORF Transcript_44296/g.60529 Transcript_44296/m.60529 type:complete len:165 (+) Transcript_44296:108-602(+)